MFDITNIIEAAFALIGVVITTIVVPYIKSRTTAQQQSEINTWVKIAVTAAEQIYKGSGRGQEKKTYVIAWLREHNVSVDESCIDAMIEAAVYEMNNSGIIPVLNIPEKEGADNE